MPIEIWDCNDENYDKKCKILEIFEIERKFHIKPVIQNKV